MSINRPFGYHWRGALIVLALILAALFIGYALSAFPGWMAGLGAG